ncbi:hypothetical protein [Streptomyces rubiginosohelvolus]|uniref:hypothetical protein n=1 Tax=Streptomyces rubiginosohelvolus TaxID=67362 RepID=UPI0038647B35|nr:hypothetical protein OG475_34055 [Streptomyces rubiginosohelvolus]
MSSNTTVRPHGRGKAALIATMLVVSVMASAAPAAADGKPAAPTAQEYLAWLDADNSAEAKSVANEFKALSAENQQKFLGYLVDVEVLKAAEDVRADPDPDPETKTFAAGGDVTFEVDSGATPEPDGTTAPKAAAAAMARAGDWNCYYAFKQKVLGITVTTLKLQQWYHSTTKKVDKIYNVAATKKNWNPGVMISNEPEEQWISGAGNALAFVTWHGDATVSGFTVQLDKRQHIRCDETGGRYQYMKNI